MTFTDEERREVERQRRFKTLMASQRRFQEALATGDPARCACGKDGRVEAVTFSYGAAMLLKVRIWHDSNREAHAFEINETDTGPVQFKAWKIASWSGPAPRPAPVPAAGGGGVSEPLTDADLEAIEAEGRAHSGPMEGWARTRNLGQSAVRLVAEVRRLRDSAEVVGGRCACACPSCQHCYSLFE